MNFLDCQSKLTEQSFFQGSKIPKINHVARGFVENYDRVMMMLHLPQHVAYNGIVVQHNWALAKGDRSKFDELQNYGKGVDEKHAPRLRDLADKVVTIAESPSELMESSPVHKGLEALLASTVTAAWTAFETMAADLWVAALNERPRLAFVALGVEPDSTDSEEEALRKRQKKLSFPAWMLLDSDFDLRNEMGTAVSKMRKWDFARRNQAASAYQAVFYNEDGISSVFKDSQLGWLVATRNAVVHNAGLADDEFLKLTATHPEFKNLACGDRIPLCGKIAGELASSAFIQGKNLFKIVDDWLVANPR